MKYQLFKVIQNMAFRNADGKILVLKHKTGKWLLPGGKINKGENWEEGLRREVSEETGIKNFEPGQVFDIDSWIDEKDGYYVVTFLVESSMKNIVLSDEHVEYAWIGREELDKLDFWHEKIRKRVRKVLE